MNIVQSRMSDTRLTPVSVNADGTLAIPSQNVTVAKTNTGEYTVTFVRSHQRTPFAYATPVVGAARALVQVPKASLGAKSLIVKTFSLADAAADAPFDLLVFGADGGHPLFGGLLTKIRSPLHRPRLIPAYFDGANNSLSGGKNDIRSVTKTGTGLYTVVFRQSFSHPPYVLAVSNALNRAVEVTSKTNIGFSLQAFNSTTAAAADTEVFMLILGGDARMAMPPRRSVPVRCRQPWTVVTPFEYDGTGESVVRGSPNVSVARTGAGAYDVSFKRKSGFPGFGIVAADGAAVHSAVNNRTGAGFHIDAEADSTIYGLDVRFMRGRAMV